MSYLEFSQARNSRVEDAFVAFFLRRDKDRDDHAQKPGRARACLFTRAAVFRLSVARLFALLTSFVVALLQVLLDHFMQGKRAPRK